MSLINCIEKIYGSKLSNLVTKADADTLVNEARALEDRGLTPIEAERRAVENALRATIANGENILRQIHAQRPEVHDAARAFWDTKTTRNVGEVPAYTGGEEIRSNNVGAPQYQSEGGGVSATSAGAGGAVDAGARGGALPEVGGLQHGEISGVSEGTAAGPSAEEPSKPAEPLSEGAQAVVDGLPEEQRGAAQKGFARDDHDPLADRDRAKGKPVQKRQGKPIDPEKNTTLFAEASKYGVLDKHSSGVLRAIADDARLPKWIRRAADLVHRLGIADGNLKFRMVNTPDAVWRALYVGGKDGKPSEILINSSHQFKAGDLPRTILHEIIHHGTLEKLQMPEHMLTPGQLAAKQELQKVYDEIRGRKDIAGLMGTKSFVEFASEVFSNDKFRQRLNALSEDGKTSYFTRIKDAINRLLFGEHSVREGSLLDKAMSETLNVVGGEHMESESLAERAARMRAKEGADLVNAHPAHQEAIADLIAPMAENMGITKGERDKDVPDWHPERAFYSDKERAFLEPEIDRQAKLPEIKATKAEVAKLKKDVETYMITNRAYKPANRGWATGEIGINEAKNLKEGWAGIKVKREKATKAKPVGDLGFTIAFKKSPYTYAKDAMGNAIARLIGKRGALTENPEWAKRRQELSDKAFDDLSGIMARKGEDSEAGRRAQVILDQINWYRDMMTHLRTHFGSLSDYVADVIAGLSPKTDVPGNWRGMVDYFEGVTSGAYDDIFRRFDAYLEKGKKEGRELSATTWKQAGNDMPRKLQNNALFASNTANAMMAGLDLWRAVKTGSAPKARNFGLNLIGQSVKATIDRWAGRYLQRMHNPNWRLPPQVEGEVQGAHMSGENVHLVDKEFGMGQDVFEDVARRLRESDPANFHDLTPADLQAILWFAEKAVWEGRGYTPIMGAGSSMAAMSRATAAQRYEVGTGPHGAEIGDDAVGTLRQKINKDPHVLSAKAVTSEGIYNGERSKTFDGDIVVHPEYDPTNLIGHVAEAAAMTGRDAAHITRVIVNPHEKNTEMMPGLHVFFKGRVGDAEVNRVHDILKSVGLDGSQLSVDPRVRPDIVKSLDPETGANPYNGLRLQNIPEYGATGKMSRSQFEEALVKAQMLLKQDASVADSHVLHYDTLVLKKGVDYDDSGKLTENAKSGRAAGWAKRANDEGFEATARRNNERKAIADRERQDKELSDRIEREDKKRIADAIAFREQQAREHAAIDSANDGGIDPPETVAAMIHEDEREPTKDPHGGRASLVRSMVDRLTGASRDKGGIEVPQSQQEVRDPAGARSRTNPGRKGSAPLWGSLGATFRSREASLYKGVDEAAALIDSANPHEPGTKPEDSYRHSPTDYQNSQKLFDYLSGKEVSDDPGLRDQIAQLRKEIPTIPVSKFESLRHLDSGSEADVYHDANGGVVYKLYTIKDGKVPGAYNPGQFRLDRGGDIRISMGDKPTVQDVLSRMERGNTHGLTPNELVAVTPEGQLVFAQPFIEGRGVTQKNMKGALARAGVHLLSEMGATSGVAKLPDGRWVVYDDLHPGNVRTMPGGRVEIIDANSRELDPYEVADLQTLGKLPPEKQPPGKPLPVAPPPEPVKHYDNATLIAPMVETHHGTQHTWEPEKKIEHEDGRVEWIHADDEVPQGARVIRNAPAGRVRADKVLTGEGNIAFGWGVNYSAQEPKLAQQYREQLTSAKGDWFLDGLPMSDLRSEIYDHLKQAVLAADPDISVGENIANLRELVALRKKSAEKTKAMPMMDSVVRDAKVSDYLRQAREYEQSAKALEKYGDKLQYRKGEGNVYTLHLDVNDPELIDWYKPMKDQMHVVDKVLAKHGMDRDSARAAHAENERLAGVAEDLQTHLRELEDAMPRDENEEAMVALKQDRAEKAWHDHYQTIPVKLGQILNRIERETGEYGNASRQTGEKFYEQLTDMAGSKRKASELLDSASVPGVIYLDRESRKVKANTYPATDQKTGKKGWVVYVSGKAGKFFETEAEAHDFAQSHLTNNYVIFDPERIKVHAKNGELVGTAADEMPLAPAEPKYEPVTIAPSIDPRDVKDDTDLSIAPMAAGGKRRRFPWPFAFKGERGYEPGGMWQPRADLSVEANRIVREKVQAEGAAAVRGQYAAKELEVAMKKAYGKIDPASFKDVQMILGNMDDRLTPAQYATIEKIRDPAQRKRDANAFHMANVAQFKAVDQPAAEMRVPDIVRQKAIALRQILEDETNELLRVGGISPDLRARVTADQGVLLHSNAFQHFENDAWSRHVKSDDPEAQRIRAAAEKLFGEEINGERAYAYQKAEEKAGRIVTDAQALAYAQALPDIHDRVAERLGDYLRKTDDQSRINMLMGNMPVAREPGKMLSLDREQIPQEIKDLWGRWNDPRVNFLKTFSLLTNHNAHMRMQHDLLQDGLSKGYLWKEGMSGDRKGLVPLGYGKNEPLEGYYGPQHLKDGLGALNTVPVRDLLSKINSIGLVSKTALNIAGGAHNFLSNIGMELGNGNLIWAAGHAALHPFKDAAGIGKGVWTSLMRTSPLMHGLAQRYAPESWNARDELSKMINLGVFDSEHITAEGMKDIYTAMQKGSEVEKKAGLGTSLKTVYDTLASPLRGMKASYQMMDNFWKYVNYKIELRKLEWVYANETTKPTLEQMERKAAEATNQSLPTYNRIPEVVRKTVGSEGAGKWIGAFSSFPIDVTRTMVNNAKNGWREAVHPVNERERSLAAIRMAGALATTFLVPYGMKKLGNAMWPQNDDKKEQAIINTKRPEKRDDLHVMWAPDAKGNPQYADLGWLNPYQWQNFVAHEAIRGAQEGGVGGALRNTGAALISPFKKMQPVYSTMSDLMNNSDSDRGGQKIYNDEDSFDHQIAAAGDKINRGILSPMGIQADKIYKGLMGQKEEKTGKSYDPAVEAIAALGGPRLVTVDLPEAMGRHVSNYKHRMADAQRLFTDKMGAKGDVDPAEIGAAYTAADNQAFEIFSELHNRYLDMRELGMTRRKAEDAMEIGLGDEIRKGGLGKNTIDSIETGHYERIEVSKNLEAYVRKFYPERLKEYDKTVRVTVRRRKVPLQ